MACERVLERKFMLRPKMSGRECQIVWRGAQRPQKSAKPRQRYGRSPQGSTCNKNDRLDPFSPHFQALHSCKHGFSSSVSQEGCRRRRRRQHGQRPACLGTGSGKQRGSEEGGRNGEESASLEELAPPFLNDQRRDRRSRRTTTIAPNPLS